MWDAILTAFLRTNLPSTATVYLAIDRTGWRTVNLLVVSLIWKKRAIPVGWIRLETLGCSHYRDQTRLLSKALTLLSAYSVVVLGDREFCSVALARWLGEQGAHFCLRLKISTQIQTTDGAWQALSHLGLTPGTQAFLRPVRVAKTQGFGPATIAGKWKRRYRGFAPDEPWFILTNLSTLDKAISAYQRRFGIEEMFRDFKSGGYRLEGCHVDGRRLMAIVMILSMAYLWATVQGTHLKRTARQAYLTRPERQDETQMRHSAFRVGVAAYRWVPIWFDCQQQVQHLMRLNWGKIDYYLKGLKAMDAILISL